MTDLPVVVEHRDGVAVVRLNRPSQRNALDRAAKDALLDALTGVATDTRIRAIVLTGSGSSFCVGQDLSEHAAALERDAATAFRTVDLHYAPIVTLLATMPKPVIAAVNGTCVGAGLGFALACDLRVISTTARFATAFTAIGLTCDSGLSSTLVRAVGDARARELVLLGRTFGAEEAVAWGISGEIVPAEQVAQVADDLAARLAQGPTVAYAASKRLIADAHQSSLPHMLAAEADAQTRCGSTLDHAGAVQAFLAKSTPTFAGR